MKSHGILAIIAYLPVSPVVPLRLLIMQAAATNSKLTIISRQLWSSIRVVG